MVLDAVNLRERLFQIVHVLNEEASCHGQEGKPAFLLGWVELVSDNAESPNQLLAEAVKLLHDFLKMRRLVRLYPMAEIGDEPLSSNLFLSGQRGELRPEPGELYLGVPRHVG